MLVDKPSGITSHDVVDFIRKRLGTKKVGHAGTLDPLAEGLLIILVGKYTKFFSKFASFDKEYLGVLKLGEITTTGDSEGKIIERGSLDNINNQDLAKVFSSFVGDIDQVPPMVSAIRLKGRRLYKLARKGVTVKREPRKIKIYRLEILNVNLPFVEFYAKCSKGTYIRKLAEDIGQTLGCGAHIVKIKRLAIGPFTLEESCALEDTDERSLKTIPSLHA